MREAARCRSGDAEAEHDRGRFSALSVTVDYETVLQKLQNQKWKCQCIKEAS
jgi:hypothetical protein